MSRASPKAPACAHNSFGQRHPDARGPSCPQACIAPTFREQRDVFFLRIGSASIPTKSNDGDSPPSCQKRAQQARIRRPNDHITQFRANLAPAARVLISSNDTSGFDSVPSPMISPAQRCNFGIKHVLSLTPLRIVPPKRVSPFKRRHDPLDAAVLQISKNRIPA
jgi:hypothetical protein